MARFLLLACRARGEDLPPAELQRRTRAMMSWIARGVGVGEIGDGGRIELGGVRLSGALPEDYGSYYILDVKDLDAAIACAAAIELDALVLPLDPHATLSRR